MSPFEIFRRNLKPMMVFLTMLALFAFVVLPALDTYLRRGGAGGSDPQIAVFDGVPVTQSRVDYLTRNHQSTVRFLRELATETIRRGGAPRTPGFVYDTESQQIQQLGIDEQPSPLSTVRTLQFATEANKAGFELDDTAIKTWLNNFTDGTMSDSEVIGMLMTSTRNQMGQYHLYEQLRNQLLAELYQRGSLAGVVEGQFPIMTPAEQWANFLKINQKATIDAYGVLVNDYIEQTAKTPPEAEINAVYQEGIERYPNEQSPEPGFRKRDSATFEYLVADREAFIDREIETISEETLKAEYERRLKGGDFQLPDDMPAESESTTPATAPEKSDEATATTEDAANDEDAEKNQQQVDGFKQEIDAVRKESEDATTPDAATRDATTRDATTRDATTPDATTPDATTPDATTPDATTPDATTPDAADQSRFDRQGAVRLIALQQEADEAAEAEEPQAEEPKAEEPQAEEPQAEEPQAEEPNAEEPQAEEPQAEEPKTEEPKTEEPKTEEPQAEEPKTEEPKAEEPKTEEPQAEEPKTEEPKTEEPKTEEPKTEEPQAEEPQAEEPQASEKDVEPDKADAESKATSESDAAQAAEPKVETFEDVRDEIARALAAGPAAKEIDAAVTEAVSVMRKYFNQKAIYDSNVMIGKAGDPPTKPDLQALADKLGLEHETIGPHDFVSLESEPISQSTAMSAQMGQRGPSFTAMMFGVENQQGFIPKQQLYSPLRTQDQVSGRTYVTWKTDEKDGYAPQLEEVRGEVIQAIRVREARKLALAAAEKIASQVNAGKSLAEAIAEDRKTNLKEGLGPFSWMNSFGFQGAFLGNVPELDSVGEEFMEAVFKTEVGTAAVAPNLPERVFYVVKATDIQPHIDDLKQIFTQPQERMMALPLGSNEVRSLLQGFYTSVDDRTGFTFNEDE